MILVDLLLRRLEEAQIRVSREALQTPQPPYEFSYGKAVGMNAGLELAKKILLEMIDERNRKDDLL